MKIPNKFKDNPKAGIEYRNKQRKINYLNGRGECKKQCQRYTPDEDAIIMKHELTDREIANRLNRSVQGVQLRRSKIKNGVVKSEYKNSLLFT